MDERLLAWLIAHGYKLSGAPFPDINPPPLGHVDWAEYFTSIGWRVNETFLPLGEPAPEGARLNMVWTRTGQDVATVDLHHVHVTEGADTGPITTDDLAALEALADTLWNDLKGSYNSAVELERYVWHYFGVDVRSPNPNVRTTTKLSPVAGTGTDTQLPPQAAISVTFKTNRRRSWGRVYLPSPVVDAVDDGYIKATTVDAIRTAFGTYLESAFSAGLPLVVWSPRHNGKLLKYFPGGPGKRPDTFVDDVPDSSSFAMSVEQIQVDDLWDVIRGRRYDKPTHLATHTLGA